MLSVVPSLPKRTKGDALFVVVTIWPEGTREDREARLKGDDDDWTKEPRFVYCLDNRFQRLLERDQKAGECVLLKHIFVVCYI